MKNVVSATNQLLVMAIIQVQGRAKSAAMNAI